MSQSLVCVTEAQRDCKVGLGGIPSFETLDQDYKDVWRRASTKRKFYSCRLVLYKQIKSLAEELIVSEMVATENLKTSDLEQSNHWIAFRNH